MLEQPEEKATPEVLEPIEPIIPIYLFLLTEEEKQILNKYIKSTFLDDQ